MTVAYLLTSHSHLSSLVPSTAALIGGSFVTTPANSHLHDSPSTLTRNTIQLYAYSPQYINTTSITMRTSALIVAVTASVVHASNPGDVPYNCAKPNANYCLGGDIILRCDGNSVGTPGRCTDNLSGYPPAGGFASCWESAKEAGDAACEKNVSRHQSDQHVTYANMRT